MMNEERVTFTCRMRKMDVKKINELMAIDGFSPRAKFLNAAELASGKKREGR